ncbi:hypothetical protein P5008_07805 [Helcococcus ovis]|uniref:hypothetical protein n=1 Tax=Helcococcus ovis TaxID=72026 RepID=UPI003916F7BC
MQCFNCGNDADMEVFMMINGKMKKISICNDCYQEQLKNMVDSLSDENGEIDPEEIQKKMFKFFKDNKDEFEKFISEAINDENFDMNNLNPENFDVTEMNFENSGIDFSRFNGDFNDIFKGLSENSQTYFRNTKKREKDDFYNEINRKAKENSNVKDDLKQAREIRMLKHAVEKKKEELNLHLQKEDYLAAATSRDEMREINKKIMIIRQLQKEVNK